MELTVTLSKEEWEFVLEVLNLNNTNQIKNTAIGLLKPQLDEQFKSKENVGS
jgi:hypothetical protein